MRGSTLALPAHAAAAAETAAGKPTHQTLHAKAVVLFESGRKEEAIIAEKDDLLFVVLEWVFVGLRLAHAYVHTGSNNLLWRFQAFVAGALVLTIMWIVFAVRILAAI